MKNAMRSASWTMCVVATAAAVGGLASEHSAAVFQDTRLRPSHMPAQAQHVIRQRLASVDLERFGQVRQRAQQGLVTGLALNLWDDAEFEALIDRTGRARAGYTLSGRLAGVRHGAATLVVNNDVVVGTVWTPTALYDIRMLHGLQVLREVDTASLPPLARPLVRGYPYNRRGASATVQPESDSDDGSVVELLVLWTARAVKRAGGIANIQALTDLGVAAANDAYARSGVRFRLSLVGAEQTDFPDLGSEPVEWYGDAAAAQAGRARGAVRRSLRHSRRRRRGSHQHCHGNAVWRLGELDAGTVARFRESGIQLRACGSPRLQHPRPRDRPQHGPSTRSLRRSNRRRLPLQPRLRQPARVRCRRARRHLLGDDHGISQPVRVRRTSTQRAHSVFLRAEQTLSRAGRRSAGRRREQHVRGRARPRQRRGQPQQGASHGSQLSPQLRRPRRRHRPRRYAKRGNLGVGWLPNAGIAGAGRRGLLPHRRAAHRHVADRDHRRHRYPRRAGQR